MKKRIVAMLLVLVMLVGYVPSAVQATEITADTGNPVMQTFYVSPDGDDANAGTESAPFATLEKAKAAVDAINDAMYGDIVVYLMDGVWELEDTLSFGQSDSGTNGYYVRYEAAPGASPMISGGTKLANSWTDEDGDGIYSIPLDRDVKLRALYVNGQRRYMAHTESAVAARGTWGTYVIGATRSEKDYEWETIYSESFDGEVAVGTEGAAIQKFAKNGNTSNAVVNVVDGALQIAHTGNSDYGFEIPGVTYQNGLITYRIQFSADHKFTHQWEALHMHGANKVIDANGRTTWAGIKLAPHLQQTYFQYGSSGGTEIDDATEQLNTTAFVPQSGAWYQIKMLVTADGTYLTKIWKDGDQEPTDWSRRETFSGLENQDLFFRIYAYKNNNRSTMSILVDDIQIQRGTLKTAAAEPQLPDWAWTTGSKADGLLYDQSAFPMIHRNIEDVEIENQQVWNKNTVCVREMEAGTGGKWILKLQQPYGAIAQTPGWGVGLKGSGSHIIHNAYELLDQPGEFYFDRAAKTLYYKPMAGEDLSTAEVFVPRVETLAEFKGTPVVYGDLTTAGEKTITGQVKNIIFHGVTFAHSDWNLQKVGDSYGKSTVQAGSTYIAYATNNWHADMYRNLDLLPGAIEMEHAHSIKILNGEIKLTGAEGVVLSNDVDYCEVSGNYFYQTGGSGVVVGHPQGLYENDSLDPENYYYKYISGDGKPEVSTDGAGAEHERWQNGTERVPRHVTVSNNLLEETCRLFPSHCPITSYFTQYLEVSSNFIYDSAYSGMNIGWGWGNFDGETDGSNWGTENNQGYAILPGNPTATCFGNTVVNNRLDTTMTILHDGGLIYTLGSMPDSVISGNYGIHSERGIYQDEGSAYILIDNNVSVDNSLYSYYAGKYGRKHDLTYRDNFTDANKTDFASGVNVTSENLRIIADKVWPKEASDVVQNSGLTAEYRSHFASRLVAIYGSVQNALLPADAELLTGESLILNAWLDAEDEIWLAPAGTTEFAEGPTMTKAAGNAAEIQRPAASGTYYLYVKQDGTFSAASQNKIRATGSGYAITASVESGTYETVQTVALSCKDADAELHYTTDGAEPTAESTLYTAPITISATTTLKVAAVKNGVVCNTQTFSYLMADPYALIPAGAKIHLDASKLTGADGSAVSSWADADGLNVAVSQTDSNRQPVLVKGEDYSHVHFDGTNDYLNLNNFLTVNGLTGMTVVLVTRHNAEGVVCTGGDLYPAVHFSENGSWGNISISPYQEKVIARFGVGSGSYVTRYTRPSRETGFSATVAMKNGTTDQIYVDGELVLTANNRPASIMRTHPHLFVGGYVHATDTRYFDGDIAEVLIYDHALTEQELINVNTYLKNKYDLAQEPAISTLGCGKLEAEDGELIIGPTDPDSNPEVTNNSNASNGKVVHQLSYAEDGIRLGTLNTEVNRLEVVYTSKQSNGGTVGIYVNGTKVKTYQTVNTGSWTSKFTTVTVDFDTALQPGDVLEVQSESSNGLGNVDYFVLSMINSPINPALSAAEKAMKDVAVFENGTSADVVPSGTKFVTADEKAALDAAVAAAKAAKSGTEAEQAAAAETLTAAVAVFQAAIKIGSNTPVVGMTLNHSQIALVMRSNDTVQLTPVFSPETATNQAVSWTTSNVTVATVDENGLVTARGAGTAVITATSKENGMIKASCRVTITDPVGAVETMISNIDDPVTLESLAKIVAAEVAYGTMTEAQKALVTNAAALTAARAEYNRLKAAADKLAADKAAAAGVDAKIEEIGEVTLDSKDAIEAARNAYTALEDDQEQWVTKLDVLKKAEARLADLQAANAVDTLIDLIGEVTLGDKAAIEAAEKAYNALTEEQQAEVKHYADLTAARAEYNRLKAAADKLAADKAAAKGVDDLIDTIGEVDLDSKDRIEAVRAAYEALTADEKAHVTKLAVLEAAEAEYARLEEQRDLLISMIIAGASNPKMPFTDVTKADWFYDEVNGAWQAGLINGMTETTFEPNGNLTVAQAIKLAAALHQRNEKGRVTLKNGDTAWYSSYVEYAVRNKIIGAEYLTYSDGKMNSAVSRAEFVHILHGAMSYYKWVNNVADNAIPDVKTGSAYASEIYEFYRAGILTGSEANGTFYPASSIKRSEVAAILVRMYDKDARQAVTLN